MLSSDGWQPKEVQAILDNRNDPRWRMLCNELTGAVDAGRKLLLLREPWWQATGRAQEDDIQLVLEYLLAQDARILRKYGAVAGFTVHPKALRIYVMGVTQLKLRKGYQRDARPICRWDELQEEILADGDSSYFAGIGRFVRMMDLDRAVASLSGSDQELFRLMHVEQVEPIEVCTRLGLTLEALQQRKSRLIKRIKQFILGRGESNA